MTTKHIQHHNHSAIPQRVLEARQVRDKLLELEDQAKDQGLKGVLFNLAKRIDNVGFRTQKRKKQYWGFGILRGFPYAPALQYHVPDHTTGIVQLQELMQQYQHNHFVFSILEGGVSRLMHKKVRDAEEEWIDT